MLPQVTESDLTEAPRDGPVGRDSVEPISERSEANEVSVFFL